MHSHSSFIKAVLILVFIVLGPGSASGALDSTYPSWAKVLKDHVTLKDKQATSEVAYSKLKLNPAPLLAFVKEAESVTEAEFEALTQPEKVAFLVNFYNAISMKLVIENLPLKSFKDIGGLFANPWKRKNVFTLFGDRMSLDVMAERWIAKVTPDPRVHFVLTTSSKGGPRQGNEPLLPKKLDVQLEEAALLFVGDRTRNGYEPNTNTFEVSSLFKWHRDDFIKGTSSVQKFLATRMKIEPRLTDAAVAKANVKYLEFDWTLNGL